MRLGRAATYGVLAMLAIDRDRDRDRDRDGDGHRDGHRRVRRGATARQIAESSGIPCEYLRKVLQRLTRARLVRSERGRTGGFYLRRSLDRITLLHVIEAIEGPIDELAFFDDDLLGPRPDPTARRLKRWRHDAAAQLRQLLRRTTLRNMLQRESNGVKHRMT
jgi:Rrf2 family protein